MSINNFPIDVDLEQGLHDDTDSLEVEKAVLRPGLWGKRSQTDEPSAAGLPLRLIRRLTSTQPPTPTEVPWQVADGRELVSFLSSGDSATTSFKDACSWYVGFIDLKCRTAWPLIQEVVIGITKDAKGPNDKDIDVLDRVLMSILSDLSSRRELALVDIADELVNAAMVRDHMDDERRAMLQLIFKLLGWLSMLYEPKGNCKRQGLNVAKLSTNSSGNRVHIQSRSSENYTQNIDECDQPIWQLLGKFGKLIPVSSHRTGPELAPPSEWIITPYVCYRTLRKVCRIEVEWVDSIGMHLEFDSSRRVLQIFRFPSFCRLMYRHGQRGLLSQLFDDNECENSGASSTGSHLTNEFFREMLLTYRLIFGQDNLSWRLFATEATPRARANRPSLMQLQDADPMLLKLCGRSCDDSEVAGIYEDIHADNVQPYYLPSSYPFFAEKLLALQAYVKNKSPTNLKSLWHDHRNTLDWWKFWPVLLLGAISLVLATLSLVFQILQVVIAEQQLRQGNSGISGA